MTEPAELPQLRPPEEHAEGTLDLPDGVQVLEGRRSAGVAALPCSSKRIAPRVPEPDRFGGSSVWMRSSSPLVRPVRTARIDGCG